MSILGNVVVRLKNNDHCFVNVDEQRMKRVDEQKQVFREIIKVSFQIVYKLPPVIVKQSRNFEKAAENFSTHLQNSPQQSVKRKRNQKNARKKFEY